MPRKIDAGDVVAAAGGLLVVISLFLDWFGAANGWQAFEALDLTLAVLGAAALAAALADMGFATPLVPAWLPWLGAILVFIVAVQLIDPPPGSAGADLEAGGWLALGGAALVAIGGFLRVARIDVTVSIDGREARTRVAAVDRRPSRAARALAEHTGDAAERPATDVSRSEPPTDGDGYATRSRSLLDDPPAEDPQATQPFRAIDER